MTQLFVDMDGVVADFETGYRLAFEVETSKALDNADWNLVRGKKHFYRDLPPMPDFDVLWKYVSQYSPILLTGVPDSIKDEATANKREFVDKLIGKDQPMIACKSSEKALHIKNPGDILVDDWPKYRGVWIAAGGRWVTHRSAVSTIEELGYMYYPGGRDRAQA